MKLSKRDFVKGAAATVVIATAASRVRVSSKYDAVVYNEWFPQARTFADELGAQGALVLPVAGDAGRLWYDRLRELVSQDHPRRIAGMTTHTDLLILETLARDTRLRVSQRESTGRLVSWVLL